MTHIMIICPRFKSPQNLILKKEILIHSLSWRNLKSRNLTAAVYNDSSMQRLTTEKSIIVQVVI